MWCGRSRSCSAQPETHRRRPACDRLRHLARKLDRGQRLIRVRRRAGKSRSASSRPGDRVHRGREGRTHAANLRCDPERRTRAIIPSSVRHRALLRSGHAGWVVREDALAGQFRKRLSAGAGRRGRQRGLREPRSEPKATERCLRPVSFRGRLDPQSTSTAFLLIPSH